MNKINLQQLIGNTTEIGKIANIIYTKIQNDNLFRCEVDVYLGSTYTGLELPQNINITNVLEAILNSISDSENYNMNYIDALNVRPYIHTDLNVFFNELVYKRQNENEEQVYMSIQEMELEDIVSFLKEYSSYHTYEEYLRILRFSLSVMIQKDNGNEEMLEIIDSINDTDLETLYQCVRNDLQRKELKLLKQNKKIANLK